MPLCDIVETKISYHVGTRVYVLCGSFVSKQVMLCNTCSYNQFLETLSSTNQLHKSLVYDNNLSIKNHIIAPKYFSNFRNMPSREIEYFQERIARTERRLEQFSQTQSS